MDRAAAEELEQLASMGALSISIHVPDSHPDVVLLKSVAQASAMTRQSRHRSALTHCVPRLQRLVPVADAMMPDRRLEWRLHVIDDKDNDNAFVMPVCVLIAWFGKT